MAQAILLQDVENVGSREGGENGSRFTPQSDVPADTGDFEPARAGAGTTDDDIPF